MSSPNLSTVVLDICGRSVADFALLGHSGHPPNKVTSVEDGLRLKAVALCQHLGCRLGTMTCTIKIIFPSYSEV